MAIPPDQAPSIKVSSESFVGVLVANVDDKKLTDAAFRQFCRNSVQLVEGVKYISPDVQFTSEVEELLKRTIPFVRFVFDRGGCKNLESSGDLLDEIDKYFNE